MSPAAVETSTGGILTGRRDHTASHDRIGVVERRDLAGCDAERGLVELELEAVIRRPDARGNRLRPIAELRVGVLDRHMDGPFDLDPGAGERRARPDDDRVGGAVAPEGIKRFSPHHTKPAALTRRAPPRAVAPAGAAGPPPQGSPR